MGRLVSTGMEQKHHFQYIRKSKFEVFSKLKTLKNHRTINYLKQIEPGTSDISTNPLVIVKPVNQEPGLPPEVNRIIHSSVIQTGGNRSKVSSEDLIAKEALSVEPIETTVVPL